MLVNVGVRPLLFVMPMLILALVILLLMLLLQNSVLVLAIVAHMILVRHRMEVLRAVINYWHRHSGVLAIRCLCRNIFKQRHTLTESDVWRGLLVYRRNFVLKSI